jgi:ribosomal protein S18 acetylase RimI-like enzyme
MVRKISIKDKENWKKLYKGYADFYKSTINDIIMDTVWSWLMDKNHEVKGIVYEIDGNLTALAHYRAMPRPLKGKYIGFLDDLYVDPNYRNQKIGQKLMNEIKAISKSEKWDLVRWITHQDNTKAKSLYDKISKKTIWEVYEMK